MDANGGVHSHPNLWTITQKDRKTFNNFSGISSNQKKTDLRFFFSFHVQQQYLKGKIHTCSSILPMLGKNVWEL